MRGITGRLFGVALFHGWRMSDEIERLIVRIEANATQFETTLKKLNRSVHGASAETRKSMAEIQKSVDGAAMGIRRSALMATTALTTLGLSFGATQLVKDFREGEEAAKRLEAALKVTGHAAGLSYGEIATWARELEEATGRGSTEIQNAAAQLATFTSIGRREFTEAIEVANDMAAVFGGDLKSNLDAVARALDDPIEGFANLRKRGFSLTDQELKRAEAHMKAGRYAEAQQVVLSNLSSQVKGTAAAVNTGLTKALNDLQRQAGDTFKALADQRGTAAAITALELATKTTAFLGEHMDVLLDAAQALAVFVGTQYVVSWLAAEKGMVRTVVTAARAEGAIRALNAALSANAVGLATLAIAGLAAGITFLVKRTSEGEVVARRLAEQTGRTSAAFAEYEKAARNAAAATGEAKKQADALVATKRELYFIELRNAQALAETTLQMAAQRAEMAKLATVEALNRRPKSEGEALGQMAFAGGAEREAERAQKQAEEANQDYINTLKDYAELQERIRTGFKDSPTPLDYTDKNAGKEAKKAEARRRALEDMKAEVALQVAQLSNDYDRVRTLEREAAVRQRTRALLDAEVTKDKAVAAAQAEAMQKRLDAARAIQLTEQERVDRRDRDRALWEIDERPDMVRQLEREAELEERIAFWRERDRDLVTATSLATSELAEMERAREDAAKRNLETARAQHAITVAQLSGNARLTRQLEDQAEIRSRTKTYQNSDHRLGAVDAERRATEEVTRERVAATYGQHRDLFASAFSDGIRAALAGDLQGFLSNQFGNFADMAFKKAGEEIYDAVFGGVSAISDGATQGAAMAATVTPAITGAGTVVAAEWVAAITSAGTAAGVAMATSISAANASAFLRLPGFDRGGYTGPGAVNQVAGVAHKGEVVFSQRDVARHGGPAAVDALRRGLPGYANGGVVGSGAAVRDAWVANQRLGQVQAVRQEMLLRLVVDEGPMFAPRVEKIAGPISVKTAATGVAYSQNQAREATQRRRQSFVG